MGTNQPNGGQDHDDQRHDPWGGRGSYQQPFRRYGEPEPDLHFPPPSNAEQRTSLPLMLAIGTSATMLVVALIAAAVHFAPLARDIGDAVASGATKENGGQSRVDRDRSTAASLMVAGQHAARYRRENNALPATMGDLQNIGLPARHTKDAWGNSFTINWRYITSAGADLTPRTRDDLYYDIVSGSSGRGEPPPVPQPPIPVIR